MILNRMPLASLVCVAGLACSSLSSFAAEPPASGAGGRYAMTPVEGGFLRLDTVTGSVSLCSMKGTEWSCAPVADKSAATAETAKLEAENKRLQSENHELKEALKPADPATPSSPPAIDEGPPAPKATLPTEEEIDKAFDYVEGIFKKFRDRLKRLDLGDDPPKDSTL